MGRTRPDASLALGRWTMLEGMTAREPPGAGIGDARGGVPPSPLDLA